MQPHYSNPKGAPYLLCMTNRIYIMIQDDIINELQYIPEAKLIEIYDLIHYFRLGLNNEAEKQISQENNFEIDKAMCLSALEKIKQGDFSSFSEIDDVNAYIEKLRHEIN